MTGDIFTAIEPGKKFYLNPVHGDVDIKDIAKSLSNICRFNGRVNEFYSVAAHSILASEFALEEFKLEALLHDAHESILGDISTPIKELFRKINGEPSPLDNIEDTLERYFRKSFGLPETISPEVKEIDKRLAVTEAIALGVASAEDIKEWEMGEPYPIVFVSELTSRSPTYMRDRFILKYKSIVANQYNNRLNFDSIDRKYYGRITNP